MYKRQASVTANTTETGISLDFVVPVGATGATGATGEQGPIGATGPTGVSPTVEVGSVSSGAVSYTHLEPIPAVLA